MRFWYSMRILHASQCTAGRSMRNMTVGDQTLRRHTSPNENFEYGYPHSVSASIGALQAA